jgi:hypothetical protein
MRDVLGVFTYRRGAHRITGITDKFYLWAPPDGRWTMNNSHAADPSQAFFAIPTQAP